MEITEIRIYQSASQESRWNQKLVAYCSVTFDSCFVVKDLKIVQGDRLFVCMPSRRMEDHCPQCDSKNHLRQRWCGQCGLRLRDDRHKLDYRGRPSFWQDICHPVNIEFREKLEKAVLEAYQEKMKDEKSSDNAFGGECVSIEGGGVALSSGNFDITISNKV